MFSNVFERLESNVRVYCRQYDAVFSKGKGSYLIAEDGRRYLDFLANAGALNYGHNNPRLQECLVNYIKDDGVTQAMDMHTIAKRDFLTTFESKVLVPRKLNYKFQFTGPTGTNVVEAAIKLARKVTGRTAIAAFTNAFHGVSLGALAATGNGSKRRGAHTPLHDVIRLPFDGYFGPGVDTAAQIRKMLTDPSSGFDLPAAFIFETVQGEGGLNAVSERWYQQINELAAEIGALVIVDDIQSGCGRTGTFFSFERLGQAPDMVCLSKSISGFGLPMSLLLLKPNLDAWEPGEHNGTFRGNNLAFVTAKAAIDLYWTDATFSAELKQKDALIKAALEQIAGTVTGMRVKGRGLMQGLECPSPQFAAAAIREAFSRGLIIETCGPREEVIKLLPPLTATEEELGEGLGILSESVAAVAMTFPGSMPARPRLIAR